MFLQSRSLGLKVAEVGGHEALGHSLGQVWVGVKDPRSLRPEFLGMEGSWAQGTGLLGP